MHPPVSGFGAICLAFLTTLAAGELESPLALANRSNESVRTAAGGGQSKSVLELDKGFVTGSRISASEFSLVQTQNLFILGKVWGFLKYHLPSVAKGEHHLDFELFRVLPDVLAAESLRAGQDVLVDWVRQLGIPQSCRPCAESPEDPYLLAGIAWINDNELLGSELLDLLKTAYRHRFSGNMQFFVNLEGIGIPHFSNELDYPSQVPPDAGYRILALFRLWNIIEYWSPYRDLIDENWDEVLTEFLPRFASADSWDAYRLELFALITRIDDGHASLWNENEVRPPRGSCFWPVAVRYVEGQMVVTWRSVDTRTTDEGLKIGDVILSIDGNPIEDLIHAWSPYYSASNEPRRMYKIARFLSRGDCGESKVEVLRERRPITLSQVRIEMPRPVRHAHDLEGNAFQLLSPEVAYLKLSGARQRRVDEYLEKARNTQGWIIDIRGHPAEFMVFALGAHLVSERTDFARFTVGSASNPGAFVWTDTVTIEPGAPRYEGEIVILVDEASISSSEYTAMAFRSAPNSVVIGSTTAGADGNVSRIPLPGGLQTAISGIGVFYPDRRPTQRIGIVPGIEVTPAIEGIRLGRDEVLEAAVEEILGRRDADDSSGLMSEHL